MSLLSAMVSIVHVAYLIPVPGFMAGTTADIEVRRLQPLPPCIDRNKFRVQQGVLDLMICNILVLVTSLYRFFPSGEDIENTDNNPDLTRTANLKPPESSPLQMDMDTLTTVDLERFEIMSIHSTQSAPGPTPQSGTTPMCNLSLRSSIDAAFEQAC